MQNNFKRIFTLAAYSDPVARQRAWNSYLFATLMMALSILAILSLIAAGFDVSSYLFPGAIAALTFLSFIMIQQGQQRESAWLLTITIIVVNVLAGFYTDERTIPTASVYGIWLALFVTGLVMTSLDVVRVTGLTILGMIVAMLFGLRAPVAIGEASPEVDLATNAFTLSITVVIGAMAWLSARNAALLTQVIDMGRTARQLNLTQTVTRVSQRLSSRLELQTLLDETVEIIREQFEDIYHAQVFLVDEAGETAFLRASTGEVGQALLARNHALDVGSRSVIGRVTQSGEHVLAAAAVDDPVHKANELLPETLTELALPLRTREGVIGALDVQSTKRNAFGTEDINILQSLADQIAIAVENARLFEAAQNETERATAIANASQITSRITSNFEDGIQQLFRTIAAPGSYSHWWFGLLTSDGSRLRRVTSHRSEITAMLIPDEFDVETDRNTVTEAAKKKQVFMMNSADPSSSLSKLSIEMHETFGKHVTAPVFAADGERVLGVLLVGRSKQAHDLDERDLSLVSTLSSQISITLENQRLFNQVQSEQRTLQSVLDAMPTAIVVLNPKDQITVVNEQAQIMFGEAVRPGQTFDIAHPIYRTGTDDLYPSRLLPVYVSLERGQIYAAEDLTIRRPDGASIDALSRAAPIYDRQGQVSAVVSVYQDITELRELERALQESLNETTKLYEASRAISHATSLTEVADSVANQMFALSPSRVYMTIARENPDPDSDAPTVDLLLAWPNPTLPPLEEVGLPMALLLPETGLGTTNLTFATQHLHLIPGLSETELAELQNSGIKGLTVLPLEARGEVFGSIIGVFEYERAFAPEERRFLLTLADQTSVVLDAINSFQETQQALRSLSRLYSGSRAIAQVQDVNEALQVLRQQVEVLRPDRVDVLLSREREGLAEPYNALAWMADYLEEDAPVIPHDIVKSFDILSGDEYYIEDLYDEDSPDLDAFTLALIEQRIPYQALASVPFQAAGMPTGRLTVGYKYRRKFSENDRQFLRLLADATAYVIENDMLFRQTQDSLEETGILYQAIRAFANADDKEGILQAIIDYAADPTVDKAMLCLLLTDTWFSPNALMEVVVSWVRRDSIDLTGMRFTAEQFPSWEQIATEEILWVNDVMLHDGLDDTAKMGYRALDIASFVIVPLVKSGRSIGAILLGSSEPRIHTEREIRIYQSLADQAAITMESLRLFEEAEGRARQLATSAQISQSASSILKIDELLPEAVDLIKDAFTYDQVQIFLLDEAGEHALLKASTGEAGRQLLAINHSLPVGSRSVIGTVTKSGKPSIALDTADARVIHKPNPYLPNTRSEMAIPLISREKILGALDVQSNQPGAFTEADVRVLSVLADQLAIAIENANLFALSQLRTEEMGFMFNVIAESTTSGEVQDILQRVSQLLLEQTDAALVAPYIFDDEQMLHLGAVASRLDAITVMSELPQTIGLNSSDIIAQVAHQRRYQILRGLTPEEAAQTHIKHLSSGLYMPLVTSDSFVGVLLLESDMPNHFSKGTIDLLQALSASLSAVIQNSQLLADIQAANERLREIDQLKTNFLAAMSHELRTPLNSIIGFSRVILKGIDGPTTDMQQQDLQTIHDSGKHLLGLVNDILDQAKIEAGKMELSKEYFDVVEVIKGVMSTAVGMTKEKPIRLHTEIAPDLPKGFGDEFRTRQVMLNLLSNAAKFTDEGSIATTAHVITGDDERQYIQISVTDTGMGIKQEDFRKLFEAFQQVDNTTTRSHEGTGLGLPLAKSLTELQGGHIWVQSEFGVGSTFSITIPTQPPPITVSVEPIGEGSTPAPSNGKKEINLPRTVIVVDDSIDMINFYRRHMSNNGYDVLGVVRAEELHDILMKVQPTIIVINAEMEEGRGWELLADLQQRNFTQLVPIIINSLYEDSQRSADLGAALHLIRPFEPEQLIAALKKVEDRVSP